MLKLIVSTVLSVFLLSSAVVIVYWQDSKFEPTAEDLFLYLFLLPSVISLILLSPYLIWTGYKAASQKKQQNEQMQAENSATDSVANKTADVEHIRLHVYATSLQSAIGRNQEVFHQTSDMLAPTLDTVLLNHVGNPILSYRMEEQLTAAEDEEFEDSFIANIQKRIQHFIQNELYENEEVLLNVVEHLKQSAMFYDQQLAYEYRIHPAWIKADAQEDEEIPALKDIPRLNHLNVHLVLSETLLHVWNETESEHLIQDFLHNLGLLPQQLKIQYHYWDIHNCYSKWMNLLKKIQNQTAEVSFLLVADSALDQELIDDHSWRTEQYIPAEFVGSCCLASQTVQILEQPRIKVLDLVLNEVNAADALKRLNIENLEQYELEQPFIVLPDNIAQPRVIQQISKYFDSSSIQPHHHLYSHYSLGHTQNLAKIYAFILGLQVPESVHGFVYSLDAAQALMHVYAEDDLTDFNQT